MRFASLVAVSILSLVHVSCTNSSSPAGVVEASPESATIVGGKEVEYNDRGQSIGNYAVSVVTARPVAGTKNIDLWYCTGSLIEQDLVLTAAHCLDKASSASDIFVFLGDKIDYYVTPKIAVKAFVVHPSTKPDYFSNNDIALLRLVSPAPAWKKIVKLPTLNLSSRLERGAQATAVGYGKTQETTDPKFVEKGVLLRSVEVVAQLQKGQSIWVLDQRQGTGICEGDSGGPLLVRDADEVSVLGVAHAVRITHRTEDLQNAMDKDDWSELRYLQAHPEFDFCRDQGEYTDVLPLVPWILKAKIDL